MTEMINYIFGALDRQEAAQRRIKRNLARSRARTGVGLLAFGLALAVQEIRISKLEEAQKVRDDG